MNDTTMNAADIEKYLSGASFPCDKQMIISEAKMRSAPKEVINALNGLPNREYSDVSDVASELDMNM